MSGGPMFCINYTAIITDRVGVRDEETGRQRQREREREIQRMKDG